MSEKSFIPSLMVLCIRLLICFVLLNLINCLTQQLSTNDVINNSNAKSFVNNKWPFISLLSSNETNHTNRQNTKHLNGYYAKELPINHSKVIEVNTSANRKHRNAFKFYLTENKVNDNEVNVKYNYKSKVIRSIRRSVVTDSDKLISGGSVGNSGTNGLAFDEEPSDSFIVRSKSAILRCKTLNALKAWFTCNTGDERSIHDKQIVHNYVDPQTGIRIIELDLEVTRNDIDEHAKAGYTTPYQCWCTAYGGHQSIVSRHASILFSSNAAPNGRHPIVLNLRKHFINEPLSQTVALSSQTSFTCLPPEGDPKPTLFWLKNGQVINASTGGAPPLWDHLGSDLIPDNLSIVNQNYFIGHDSSLIIKEVTLTDQGNYTCAVRNPAGVRYSEVAQLTVSVNGGWSSWGSWSPCNAANKCGRGSQKRIRYCSNPSPTNSGQYCTGESTQTSDCSVICNPIHGSWTSWSSWSTCSHECSQVRRRICNNPPPKYGGQHCFGHDFLIKNCTGGMCRKLDLYQLQRREREERGATDSQQQIYLMSIIITTTFLFISIIFVFVLLKRQRLKAQEWSDNDEERVGENGQSMLLMLQTQSQRPDLIRGENPEKCQLISRLNEYNTNLLDHLVVSRSLGDPLPSVPNTTTASYSANYSANNSDIVSHSSNLLNGSQISFNQLNASISGTPKLKPTSALSMATNTTIATVTTTNTTSSDDDYCDSDPEYEIINHNSEPEYEVPYSRAFTGMLV